MSKSKSAPADLDVKQDVEFQQTEWRVERIGWAIMAALLVLALLGVFGRNGPLSRTVVEGAAGPGQLTYERFVRRSAPSTIELQIAPTAAGTDLTVWVDRRFVEQVDLERVTPQPAQTITDGDRLMWTFEVNNPDEVLTVKIDFEPRSMGTLSGRLGTEDGEVFDFSMFAYP